MTARFLEILFYILDNRRGRGFKNWSCYQILEVLSKAYREKTLLLTRNAKTKSITGVVIAELKDTNMHIHAILGKPGMMKKFYNTFRLRWPAVETLTAERDDKAVTYKVETLDRRMK